MPLYIGARRVLLGAPGIRWTPASPTSDGGVLPHTWHYAGSPQLYTDAAKTMVASSDGDFVYVSTNQGSDTHDIVQATAGNRPTLKLNIVNGKPVFRLDGTDGLQGAFGAALTQPFTLCIVAQLGAGCANDNSLYVLSDGDDAINAVYIGKTSAGDPDRFYFHAGTAQYGGAANENWNIWTALLNGASSGLWHNGISQVQANAGAYVMDGLTLGQRNPGDYDWIGDIAEYLIYDSDLSDADKDQIGHYLATKYGLSWTNFT